MQVEPIILITNNPKLLMMIWCSFYLSFLEIKTTHNQQFVLFNNLDTGIVMFSYQSNIRYYNKRVFYVDGTFEYGTKFGGSHNGHMIYIIPR